MKLKYVLLSKQSISNLSNPNRRLPLLYSCKNAYTTATVGSPPSVLTANIAVFPLRNPKFPRPVISFPIMGIHALQEIEPRGSDSDASDDGPMNEFLSRFVWIMRGQLREAYPDCDKETINGMLLIIVEKVVLEIEKGSLEQMLDKTASTASNDFSDDLWRTVWEVSISVLEDMKKAKRKDELRKFLLHEDVKEMCRFAVQVGIRGDMMREFRFKWARDKMEENEFYQKLKQIREEARSQEEEDAGAAAKRSESKGNEDVEDVVEEKPKIVTLPQRHGKLKYKIYGLDLSAQKWSEASDKIHEAEENLWPEEPKPISGKCKLVTEKILSLKEEENPSPFLAEWVELHQPKRIDWLTLLNRVKERNLGLYYKIAELVVDEESFQTNIRDYWKLIDAYSKENHTDDAERILKKMSEKGIQPDILTSIVLVRMHSKAGNLERAKEAFDNLRSQGFKPDINAYSSMIMAYVSAGQPKLGESLMREMEARNVKPTKEIYMALLRSFAQRGHVDGAQRIATTMQFAGFQPDLESCTLLIEAYGQAGDPDQARNNFDHLIKLGHRPDDQCTANMIAAYEKKNLLDKALNLLMKLEKDGFEPGVATYTVLMDWLSKLLLVDEVEQILGKISEKADVPPFRIHVSLCDMYARAGDVKKALQSLGVLEAKKEQLGEREYERVINGLIAGGLVQDARRVHELMESQGFAASEPIKVALMASQGFRRQKPTMTWNIRDK